MLRSSSGISNLNLASHMINQITIHNERAGKLELHVLTDTCKYIMLLLTVLTSLVAHKSPPAQKASTGCDNVTGVTFTRADNQLLLNILEATA